MDLGEHPDGTGIVVPIDELGAVGTPAVDPLVRAGDEDLIQAVVVKVGGVQPRRAVETAGEGAFCPCRAVARAVFPPGNAVAAGR